MAKKRVTAAPPKEQAPQTVPLEAISITWMRPKAYLGEDGDQPMTITGRQLAKFLRWIALESPGGHSLDKFGDPDDVRWLLDIAADTMKALRAGSGDHDREALQLSAQVIPDLTNRMRAYDDGEETAKAATVTIASGAAA